jgi:hypothetical protein
MVRIESLWKEEMIMYQPVIKDDAIRTLYRIKRAYKRPMTLVLEDILSAGLKAIQKAKVCAICQEEANNQDCLNCYLGKEDNL